MKVRVDDIREKTIHLSADEPTERFDQLLGLQERGECLFLAPIHYSLDVSREFDHIRVDGNVSTRVSLSCSLCLNEFESPVDASFTLIYTRSSGVPMDEEVELGEEDLISVSFEGPEIDFAPVIQEQVLIELPYKPVCKDDCLGLCPNCGADRNKATCDCSSRSSSFKMSALGNLKIVK